MIFIQILMFLFISHECILAQRTKPTKQIRHQLHDYRVFKKEISSNFAGIYLYQTPEKVQTLLDSLEQSLSIPQNDLTIFKNYASFMEKLGCGHSQVLPSKKMYSHLQLKNCKLPFQCTYSAGNLYVTSCENEQLPVYSKILSINGMDTQLLIQELWSVLISDGHNESMKSHLINTSFSKIYRLYIDQSDTLNILYDYNGKINSTIVIFSSIKQAKSNDYHQDSVAYLPTYAYYKPAFPMTNNSVFIDSLFEQLAHRKLDHFIIDLRDNGGGKSQNQLISHLINSSIISEVKTVKYTKRYNFRYKKKIRQLPLRMLIRILRKKETPWDLVVNPSINQYKGNLYILIDGGTASAASNFAAIMKNREKTLLIGLETGGSYQQCCTGLQKLILPHSKLKVIINSILVKNACVMSENRVGGVLPDIYIHPQISTEITENSLTLALKIILQQP